MRSRNLALLSVLAGGLVLVVLMTSMPSRPACAQRKELSYSEDIVPIFKGWCVSCHQPGGEGFEASGLDLTTYEGLMKGTKLGTMVVPGKPDVSNLVVLVMGRASPEIRMPYGHKPLPSCLQRNIWTWVFEGAKNN